MSIIYFLLLFLCIRYLKIELYVWREELIKNSELQMGIEPLLGTLVMSNGQLWADTSTALIFYSLQEK